eukprot:3959319-Prymnesium_polylepis.1
MDVRASQACGGCMKSSDHEVIRGLAHCAGWEAETAEGVVIVYSGPCEARRYREGRELRALRVRRASRRAYRRA